MHVISHAAMRARAELRMLLVRPPEGWFDVGVEASFPDLVRQTFAPPLTEHGFRVDDETGYQVVLESPRIRASAVFDPQGELDAGRWRCDQGAELQIRAWFFMSPSE